MWAFLSSLLTALPTAAKSNGSLFAFILAIAAYIATVWRVSRNKQLLDNLQKLSPKDRLAALELELGGVRLASGISPEQWVRSRIHKYYFVAFAITLILVTFYGSLIYIYRDGTANISVELKQSLQQQSPVTLSNFFIHSAKAQEYSDGDEDRFPNVDEEYKSLRYTYTKHGDRVEILPELGYVDAQRRGDPVFGYSWDYTPFNWKFPELAVKVANNTRRDLVLSEIVLRVRKSILDNRPVFVVNGPSYNGDVDIDNDGWGGITNASVTVSIKSARNCDTFNPAKTFDIPLKPVAYGSRETGVYSDGSVLFSIRKFVSKDFIEKTQHCDASGSICSDAPVCVQGQLYYTDETDHKGSLKFATLTYLGRPGAGAPMPPSYTYDVSLKAGKSNYTQRESISQQIKAGEGDNFTLRIASDRSASFDFDMDILSVDGSVAWSGSFFMSIFVPKFGADCANKTCGLITRVITP